MVTVDDRQRDKASQEHCGIPPEENTVNGPDSLHL